jgi:hypothetical protein
MVSAKALHDCPESKKKGAVKFETPSRKGMNGKDHRRPEG